MENLNDNNLENQDNNQPIQNESSNEINLSDEAVTPNTGTFSDQNIVVEANMKYTDEQIKAQNFPMAIACGFGAAIIGALLWAMIVTVTGFQIVYMSIGMGLLVGFAVGYGGKGLGIPFGIIGAVLSLFGCLLGNYLGLIGVNAGTLNMGYMEMLKAIPISEIPGIISETFQAIDLLFYGVAIYMGFTYGMVAGNTTNGN
jgi:hypothetical protein